MDDANQEMGQLFCGGMVKVLYQKSDVRRRFWTSGVQIPKTLSNQLSIEYLRYIPSSILT